MTTSLLGITVLLFVAVVALLVTVFDALGRVLVAAFGAIARAPLRVGSAKPVKPGYRRAGPGSPSRSRR
jgi:hypothetical protein